MLTDQELLNLEPREPVEPDSSVFEDGCTTPPASPRPTPGIILTVEGSPDVIHVGRHRSTRRSSRRTRQASSSQHRSPSSSRMSSTRHHPQQQQNGHRLKDPTYSAGVSRSQSMRTARRPQSVDPTQRFRHRIASIPNDMTLPSDGFSGQRLASNQSLPLPDDEDVLRLRNFAITSKGIVNRGDSFRAKSRSSHSVASVGVAGQAPLTPCHQKDDSNVDYAIVYAQQQMDDAETIEIEGASAAPDAPKTNKYKVLVLGPSDVGKTALINQFMTSEYMCAYENSQGKEMFYLFFSMLHYYIFFPFNIRYMYS